jgi:hypothetical protein
MEIIPYLCIIFNTEAHFIAHKAEKCHLFPLVGYIENGGWQFFAAHAEKGVCRWVWLWINHF